MIKILFFSAPDFTDNAMYFYQYLKSLNDKRFEFIWMVSYPEIFKNDENTTFISRLDDLSVLNDLDFTFASHTNPLINTKFNKKHIVVNLSHGIGIKGQKQVSKMNDNPYYPSTLWDYIVSYGGSIADETTFLFNNMKDKSKILPVGYPRTDFLFNEKKKKKGFSTRILWMPTYKQATNDKYSEEYFDNETKMTLFDTKESLIKIDRWLDKNDTFLCMKTHRLQKDIGIYKWINENIKRIRIAKDSDFEGDFYKYLNDFDALLTDYSSIAIDFLFLDKPEGFIFTDLEEYEDSRGVFNVDPHAYSAGNHIYNIDDFKEFCLDVKNGNDTHKEKRKRVLNDFCKNIDSNSSKRLYKFICDKVQNED